MRIRELVRNDGILRRSGCSATRGFQLVRKSGANAFKKTMLTYIKGKRQCSVAEGLHVDVDDWDALQLGHLGKVGHLLP